MNQIKSSRELKAITREQLLGNYKVTILSYAIMQCIISGSLNFVESQTNLSSAASRFIYWAVYLILTLLTAVFSIGQYRLYRKLSAGEELSLKDMWYGFSCHPDKAIIIQFITLILCFVCGIPFLVVAGIFALTGQYVLFLPIGLFFILFLVGTVYVQLTLSQALYLLMDYPEETSVALLKRSARMMKGHKGKLFYLNMSFIGILALAVCSLGIGLLWAYPYMTGTRTLFYEELIAQEKAWD